MSDLDLLHRIDWGIIQTPKISSVYVEGGVIQDYVAPTYFNSFIDVLLSENYLGDELDLLLVRSNKMSLETQVSNLLGRLAEALLVKRCNENEEINRFFANTAREGHPTHPYAGKQFTAVGTGTRFTSNHPIYNIHYQPCDRQVDVIWVSKKDVKKLLQYPVPNVGISAGLQLKTGSDWYNVSRTITNYWHPVVYFDLANDWHRLNEYINNQKDINQWNQLSDWHQVKLVVPNDITEKIKYELLWFRNLLIDLLNNKVNVKYIVDMAKAENMFEIGHAITGQKTHTQVLISELALSESEQVENTMNQYMGV